MKKYKQKKKPETIVFKLLEIKTKNSNLFLKDFQKLCQKYSDKDDFYFRFEIEN